MSNITIEIPLRFLDGNKRVASVEVMDKCVIVVCEDEVVNYYDPFTSDLDKSLGDMLKLKELFKDGDKVAAKFLEKIFLSIVDKNNFYNDVNKLRKHNLI